jgi:hypothetical protein
MLRSAQYRARVDHVEPDSAILADGAFLAAASSSSCENPRIAKTVLVRLRRCLYIRVVAKIGGLYWGLFGSSQEMDIRPSSFDYGRAERLAHHGPRAEKWIFRERGTTR